MPKENLTPESYFHNVGTQFVVSQMLFSLNQTGILTTVFEAGEIDESVLCQKLNLDLNVVTAAFDYLANVTPLFNYQNKKISITEFGKAFMVRFGRRNSAGELHLNFWDVRIGAYGNVWKSLDKLSTKKATYGQEVKREGKFAEDGVFVAANKFWPVIKEIRNELDKVDLIAEFGVNSGLIKFLDEKNEAAELVGIDRSEASINRFKDRFKDHQTIKLIQEDISNVSNWSKNMNKDSAKLFFSIHFHEFLAMPGLVEKTIKKIKENFKKSYLLVLEQPRYDESEKEKIEDHMWQYSHSNILIHHLIGNGKILDRKGWIDLFEAAGGKVIKHKPIGYLGYELFLIEL